MNKILSTKVFIITLILIFVSGLAFIGGLYFFLNGHTSSIKPSLSLGKLPITKEPETMSLNLSLPDDDLLVFSDSLEFSGSTCFSCQVLITSQDDDLVTQASDKGNFSAQFNLSPGLNEIKVVVFDKEGMQKEVTRTIYFSKEKI